MYYVYVIRNEEGRLYTGFTSDLRKRLEGHNNGDTKSTLGSKWDVVYYEAYKSEKDARLREKQLKKSSGSKRWLKERIRNSLES